MAWLAFWGALAAIPWVIQRRTRQRERTRSVRAQFSDGYKGYFLQRDKDKQQQQQNQKP